MRLALLCMVVLVVGGCADKSDPIAERARELADSLLIIDGHIDVPYRMTRFAEDISESTLGVILTTHGPKPAA